MKPFAKVGDLLFALSNLLAPPLVLVLVGCGGTTREPNAPLSAAAAKIAVTTEAKKGCKKLGTAIGRGHDLDDKVADAQALDATREQAVKLGGDTIVIVTQTAESTAGSGGTYQNITKTADVFTCTGAP